MANQYTDAGMMPSLQAYDSPATSLKLEIQHRRKEIKGQAFRNGDHAIFFHFFPGENKRLSDASLISAKKKTTQEELYRRLYIAREYIDLTYSCSCSLDELARVAFMSPHHLLRQFRHFFGITPHQYLTLKRLHVAKHLLKGSRKTVSEICNEVGYEDVSSFTKLFKARFSISPGKFRAQT
jgi:AraC family transcriptional regulator